MSVFVAILGLAFLVFTHEAGHFCVARAVGMRPRKFYVGFPPALVKFRRKGIEYGIGAIPLGGYVRIPGMHRPAPSDLEAHLNRALREEPRLLAPLERTTRALAAEDHQAARDALAGLHDAVERADLTPAAQHAAERGLTDVDEGLAPDAYWRQRAWKKVAVIFAGPGTNLAFALVVFAIVFMVAGGKGTSVVDRVLAGRPAASAGLQAGDRILEINHRRVKPAQIVEEISGSNGRPLTLTVRRQERMLVLGPVRPEKIDGVYRLGFVLKTKPLGFGAASWKSIELTGIVTREIGKSLVQLVHGDRKNVSSPVGIVRESSNAAERSAYDYLLVLGFISLSLALLNLLPLLPLDGGHIAFSLIEAVRGRAVGREVYERVSALGLALVLVLFFIGLSNDVDRIGGG
jgi:regulator of sigma E protease